MEEWESLLCSRTTHSSGVGIHLNTVNMKGINIGFNKTYNLKCNYLKFVTSKIVFTCSFLMLSLAMPLQAQNSNSNIDKLRAEIQEAFLHNVIVLSTSVIESTENIPKHIFIRGYTMPTNYFQMRFPIDDWNKKLFMNGCGMGCGTLPSDISGKLKKALQRGYATATMNSGHWATNIMDLSWAFNNRRAEEDYAYRSVHETLYATKALIKIFYDREAIHSYFWGCSNGGRQGVMVAARYSEDFDGIISDSEVATRDDLVALDHIFDGLTYKAEFIDSQQQWLVLASSGNNVIRKTIVEDK